MARWNRLVEEHLVASPGALGYSVQKIAFGREFWTLSIWSDRPSMIQFVRSEHHAAAAAWLKSMKVPASKYAEWDTAAPSIDWPEAHRRLGMDPPRGRVLQPPTEVPPGWR